MMYAKNSRLAAALRYARRGWYVLPVHSVREGRCTCGDPNCSRPGKHPRTLHGVKDATTDPEVIRGWFKQWPGANIGVAGAVALNFVSNTSAASVPQGSTVTP